MTAQNATPKSVQVSQVLQAVKDRYALKPSPIRRRQISSLSENLKDWGDFVIYQEQELRYMVADSISHRLGRSKRYVRSRLDQIHRIANYEV